jgi:carboxylesterase
VICARHDHVVPARDGLLVFALLGSAEKELLILEHSYHEVLHDVEQSLVEERICRFCIRLSSHQTAPKWSGVPMTGTDQ